MRKEFAANVKSAEKRLRFKFKNPDLLLNALTHKSYLAERPDDLITNERLEFLGDAVLSLAITNNIYDKFPEMSEGDLAKLRANIVNSETLASVAKQMGLGEDIVMGKGTEQAGGRQTVSILENTLEAIIGSIYLDKGFEMARQFLLKNFGPVIKEKSKLRDFSDAKTALQEKAVEVMGKRPMYTVIEEKGPFHDRTFISEVTIGAKVYGKGEGKSKKKAEQKAALQALQKLTK